MNLRWRIALALCVVGLLAEGGTAGAHAQITDPHQLYEDRCTACHAQHAGEFVHESLMVSEGEVIGRSSGQELREFLESGHGNLSTEEILSMVAHLTSILRSGRLFHDKCRICHVRAVILARGELVLKAGKLVGRYTGRDIEQFLLGHGRLDPDEVATMLEVLARQLRTPAELYTLEE